MADHILVLAAVMFLAGVFGGLVNFYVYTPDEDDHTNLARCLVVGVGASFLVPVVLDLVSSDLILESQADPSKLLIFTGFCLIAALSSRVAIANVNDRILMEAHTTRQHSENMEYDLRMIKENIVPLLDTETEHDSKADDESVLSPADELDVTTTQVLKTLASGRYIFRSVVGLCKDTNSDSTTVEHSVSVLQARGLAGRINSKKGLRYHVTEKGRRMLDVVI